MNRFVGTAVEAAKVGVLAWGVLWVDDATTAWFPAWPDPARYFVAALLGAVVLEAVVAIVLGVPRIQVQWFASGDGEELAALDIATTRRAMASGTFTVKVLIPPTGWLGRAALWCFVRPGTLMRIKMPNAPLKPFVEDSDETNAMPVVIADDESRGFTIDLGDARPGSGEWRWGEVRWEVTRLPSESGKYNVDYVLDHPRFAPRLLLRIFIRKPRRVKKIRVRRK